MQLDKVRAVFEKKGYTPNAYIDKREYLRILNSLMSGGFEFHEQVADELWTQAAGERPSKELRINEICTTIVDAQNILRVRIQETGQEISNLEAEKRRLQSNTSRESIRRIEQIDSRLDQLYGQKQSFEDDYRLVSEPFGVHLMASTMRSSAGPPIQSNLNPNISIPAASAQEESLGVDFSNRDRAGAYDTQTPHKYGDHVESNELKYVFYLTLVFGFVEIIMIYGKYDFLNLIVLTCLLSIYLMNFFDKVYIRLTLALLAVSIVLDLVWLIMFAGPKWNPSSVSNTSEYEVGYMRFIIFFTVVLIPLKIAITFLLSRHRNSDVQDKFIVSVGLMKILLSANKSNPISKGLANTAVLAQ